MKKNLVHNKREPLDKRKKPRLWVRLLVAVLSPTIFLFLVELALILVGYGQPKRFFVPWKAQGETFHVVNEHYCEHFVAKELSRVPEPCVLGAKGPSTMRIFVLGGSAAYGDPEVAYGFCRQLELLLNELSPEVTFEVVNAAVTSMNSHVARRIARDCATLKPDVFLVYMGNNEVVGPYGPPTLPGPLYASPAFVDLAIALKKETRIGQFIANTTAAARTPRGETKKWMGMEAFLTSQIARDDPKMSSCYRHFERNLRDIVRTAGRSGAKTILCTVPTNLKDSAPFASRHKADLTADELTQWDRRFQVGRELELDGLFEAALAQYEQARRIDAGYADLAYCMGRCLLALGRNDEAKAMFIEARDLDTLRFRADSEIEATITRVGADLADRGVTVLDLAGCLEAQTDGGILGKEFLVDHVHLTPYANFLAACAAVETIAGMLPAAKLAEVGTRQNELRDLCYKRLVYDDQEVYRLAMHMYRRKTFAPFAGQLDHVQELATLRDELYARWHAVKGRRESEASFTAALEQSPLDTYINVRYGEFLIASGRVRDAITRYQQLLAQRSFDQKIREGYAYALAAAGLRDEAVAVLTSDESPDRDSKRDALFMLGTYYVQHGMILQAQAVYQELYKIAPDNVDVLVNLAAAASQIADRAAMKRYLDRALELAPDSVPAVVNMGNYFAQLNQPREAQKWFARGVELEPQSELAHIGLGIQSIRVGETAKGIQHIAKAAEMKPDFREAYQFLAAVYTQAGQTEKARVYSELTALFTP